MRRPAAVGAAPADSARRRLARVTGAGGPARVAAAAAALGAVLARSRIVLAQTQPLVPQVQIGVRPAQNPQEVAVSLQILALLTVLSLAPAILIMMTSFTRIVVVLSFLRSALATGQMPPNQVLIGLALFLTFFVMAPVYDRVYRQAWVPYQAGQLSAEQALDRAAVPLRDFMLRQTRERDLALFVELAGEERPARREDLPLRVVVPAFVISELKTAFELGFLLFVPFLVIDMVVASALMSMGMLMLPPMMISLPFKVLLFVLVDGWHLLVRSLVTSFR